MVHRALPCGDYGLAFGGRLVASVERKSLADLATSLTSGRLRYALAELAALPQAAVAVEDLASAEPGPTSAEVRAWAAAEGITIPSAVTSAAKYGTPGKPSIPSRRRNRSSRQGCLNAEHRPPRPPRLNRPYLIRRTIPL